MKTPFSTVAPRLLVLALLGSAGLLTNACSSDTSSTPAPAQDYSTIDEGIIKKYVADNMLTAAQRQPSGLYYVPVTTNASAVQATAGKTVDVLYVGKFLDGRVFDSAQDRTKPFTFVLGRGQVIPGWDEGIALMHKGDKAVLLIPSAQAYGSRGAGNGAIPPNTVLRFDVELLDVR